MHVSIVQQESHRMAGGSYVKSIMKVRYDSTESIKKSRNGKKLKRLCEWAGEHPPSPEELKYACFNRATRKDLIGHWHLCEKHFEIDSANLRKAKEIVKREKQRVNAKI